MSIVMNKLGLLLVADLVQDGPNPMKIHLFQNNVTVESLDTISGTPYTEATFDGYPGGGISATVNNVTWDATDGWAIASWNAVTFTKSAGSTPNTIYGWYATLEDSDSTQKIVMAGNFSPSQGMINTGDAITITPTMTFKP